ncbi:MAG: VOC family protein [Pikeienuella sp.]|uniref:VOC family protein n=1 Tax=Pikeienuella sp. TaxID=2831957 RepID=UPI00391DC0AD
MSGRLALVAIVVEAYDPAILWFSRALGFTLKEDSPRPSGGRWVVMSPPSGGADILLAEAANEDQRAARGGAAGGRVAFFLETDDFAADHTRMRAAGGEFEEAPRDEPYGRVAVFRDLCGNRWDLLQRRPA